VADSPFVQASWWAERRFGISIEASLASVPSWAPLGDDPHAYATMLGGPESAGNPIPEVLAHHRDRWGHVERYDDFAELLTFDEFDAERWAELVRAAGAGFVVMTGRHLDGWAWWDAPESSRRLTEYGPRRNVIGELAAACERNAIRLASSFSLDDADQSPAAVDAVRAQAVDLVERYGVSGLWAAGAVGPHDGWGGAALLERLRSIEPGVVVNNGWRAPLSDGTDSSPIVITHVGRIPERPTAGPWELALGLGRNLGVNRAEPTSDLLDAAAIVDRYTEVIAQGGHLRLSIGADPDGTIPDYIAERLIDAGEWIRRYAPVIESCRPWTTWGDDDVRYLDDGGAVVVIDLHGTGRFAALGADETPVVGVELVGGTSGVEGADVVWTQHADCLSVSRRRGPASSTVPVVYRVTLGRAAENIALFRLDQPDPTPLAPLLADASHGDIVQLGEGDYAGPATIPIGVVLRGLGAGRTRVVTLGPDGTDPPPPTISLSRHARLENATVVGDPDVDGVRQRPTVRVEAPFATVLSCEIEGAVEVGADHAIIRASRLRSVTARNVERLLVSRCTFVGDGDRSAIVIDGGSDHEIESCRISNHPCGISLVQAIGCAIRGNLVEADTFGVRAHHTERLRVHGNQIRSTMRAVDIDGGSDALIDGNSVSHSDSGCLVRSGATGVTVAGNHWHACRAGLITWSADPMHRDNVCVELLDLDAAVISGP